MMEVETVAKMDDKSVASTADQKAILTVVPKASEKVE